MGDTALALVRSASSAPSDGPSATNVEALLTGIAADVKGLAAVVSLVDALDATDDDDGVVRALSTWGRTHAGAFDASLQTDGSVEAGTEREPAAKPRVHERPDPSNERVVLMAPAHGSDGAWVTFTVARSPAGVTDTQRRLVAVAGRLVASARARIQAVRQRDEDRDLFRRASLGSARSFLGHSPAAEEVARLVGRLAASDAVVLLEGETGVGKTFLARLLHESGGRAKAPFRVINCAAIPENLVESELFGHEKGAFTGATAARAGAFEAAGHGTLLLDEIGDLPLASQAKLLRVLEDKRFERLGSNRPITLHARVIAATHRNLPAMIESGAFRQDLYFRIAIVRVSVPALRDRGEDLVLLAAHILRDLAPSAGRRVEGFTPAALDAIRRYPWPGNVRELRNAIERAIVVGDGPRIEAGDLPDTVMGAVPVQPSDASLVRLPAALAWLEERAIAAALNATGGNQRRAALLLGINRVTLHRKLRAREGD